MTKVDEAKVKILKEIKAKEYVVGAEFDTTLGQHGYDEKPMGYRFYRLNIFHVNAEGYATFSGKGVYINTTTGKYYLHSGGVSIKSLSPVKIVDELVDPPVN